jgi:hypothetical protein
MFGSGINVSQLPGNKNFDLFHQLDEQILTSIYSRCHGRESHIRGVLMAFGLQRHITCGPMPL